MGWLYVVLLAAAVVVVAGAEWPRFGRRLGLEQRRRKRARKRSTLRVVRTETDEFAASVERDLAQLPTTEERDRRR